MKLINNYIAPCTCSHPLMMIGQDQCETCMGAIYSATRTEKNEEQTLYTDEYFEELEALLEPEWDQAA